MKKNNRVRTILQEELRELEKNYLNIIEKLKMYGYKDSSENADWTALNEKLLIYQNQIDWLKNKIEVPNQPEDKIITYRLLGTGEEKTVQLTSGKVEHIQGKISRESALGIALNEKKVGEIAEVKAKQKKYRIQIIAVK